MQIRELSATLDLKLAQLDKQLKILVKTLERNRKQTSGEQQSAQIEKEILALQVMREKLVKSKELAWRAHELQAQGGEQSRIRQRAVGILLCIVSVLGAGLLILFAVSQS